MLWCLIFMAAQIDNATALTQKGAPLPALRPSFAISNFYSQQRSNRNRRKHPGISHIKISTRNSFHHSQSITLSGTGTVSRHSPLVTRHYLFSARVLRKASRKSSSINKTAKTSRHTFRSDQDRNPERSTASEGSLEPRQQISALSSSLQQDWRFGRRQVPCAIFKGLWGPPRRRRGEER